MPFLHVWCFGDSDYFCQPSVVWRCYHWESSNLQLAESIQAEPTVLNVGILCYRKKRSNFVVFNYCYLLLNDPLKTFFTSPKVESSTNWSPVV